MWLRSLYSQLLKAQEEERRRIAKEVHDSIGSPLAADKIGLSPGATLMQIEGTDVSGMSYSDVLKALTRPEGEKLSLTVSQSGESKTVVVTSEKLL
jgi:C-terminal processing protease CtpA/Prc